MRFVKKFFGVILCIFAVGFVSAAAPSRVGYAGVFHCARLYLYRRGGAAVHQVKEKEK